jgi:hypothetical protein
MKLKLNLIISLAYFFNSNVFAKDCPTNFGKYGDGRSYQDVSCRLMVSSDRKDSSTYRNITFNNDGLIQVFSNFPGTTNSNSTGARVFYLFPKRSDHFMYSASSDGLSFTHPSGASFVFDKSGRMNSKDLKMTVASEINSKNNSGIEMSKYSSGIIIDIGYKMGNSPTLNKNGAIYVTDKNGKKCSLKNTDIHRIKGSEVELIYKTNKDLHTFLSKSCPNLDLSDLIEKPLDLKVVSKPRVLGEAPRQDSYQEIDDSKRSAKPQIDSLDSFIDSIENKRSNGTISK